MEALRSRCSAALQQKEGTLDPPEAGRAAGYTAGMAPLLPKHFASYDTGAGAASRATGTL